MCTTIASVIGSLSLADHDRLQRMVNQAEGRRLTYRPLRSNEPAQD